ncbi:MAG: hypothetical protein ABIU09_12415 [Pyrinomonadaceae bacterium]
MRRSILLVLFVAAIGVLGACTSTPEVKHGPNVAPSPLASPASSPVASPAASPSVDPKAPAAVPSAKVVALEGKWPGVEGTFLNVTKKADKYSIELKNLDKTETFEGVAKGDTIEFKRKDKLETIKAATAEETGMKWLAGEKNCVVITKGSEGYCRK